MHRCCYAVGFRDEADGASPALRWTFPGFPWHGVRVESTAELSEVERVLLGRLVEAERRRLGLRRMEEWEARAHISRKTLGKLEGGKPVSMDTVWAVAEVFGWRGDEWAQRLNESIARHNAGVLTDFVSHPGDPAPVVLERDDRILQAIDDMRRDQGAMERRLVERIERVEKRLDERP